MALNVRRENDLCHPSFSLSGLSSQNCFHASRTNQPGLIRHQGAARDVQILGLTSEKDTLMDRAANGRLRQAVATGARDALYKSNCTQRCAYAATHLPQSQLSRRLCGRPRHFCGCGVAPAANCISRERTGKATTQSSLARLWFPAWL